MEKLVKYDKICNLLDGFESVSFLASGNALVVQWLGLHASTAGNMVSIPGWGTKIHKLHSVAKKEKRISLFHNVLLYKKASLGKPE